MGNDDMETEFFGSRRRSSRPKRSERVRAKREQRRQLQPLKSSDPGERASAATTLVEQGLDGTAAILLDFVRDERNSDVRHVVAQAVLTAPVGAHPDRPAAQLHDWALAEVSRHGERPPAPASMPSPPLPPEGAAVPQDSPRPAAPRPTPIVGGTIPAEPSPDDRWRAGGADPISPRPAAPAPRAHAPAAVRPVAAPTPPPPPEPPPPPAAPTPPVVGGTVGNGSKRDDKEDEEKDKKEVGEPAPVEKPPPPVVETLPAPAPAASLPAPSVAAPAGPPDRPITWRVIRANPVDIVVWEPADIVGETADGQPETAQPSRSPTR